MKGKAADAKRELGEAKIRATEAERVLGIKEMHRWSFKKYHPFGSKAREACSHLALMHQKLEGTYKGEAQVVLNVEVEIAELEKNHEAAVKDLKVEANSQIQ